MPAPRKYSDELRERATRMAVDARKDPAARAGAIRREHLRRRRQDAPGTAVQHLFEEIKALGYTGSLNLLYKYINQGRVEADRSPLSPERLARVLLTRPDNRSEAQQEIAAKVAAACTEMTLLLDHVDSFAKLLTPRHDNGPALTAWITSAMYGRASFHLLRHRILPG